MLFYNIGSFYLCISYLYLFSKIIIISSITVMVSNNSNGIMFALELSINIHIISFCKYRFISIFVYVIYITMAVNNKHGYTSNIV